MNALFATLRALHYASAMLLVGELVFALVVARPAVRRTRADGDSDVFGGRFVAAARLGLVASIASGAAGFAVEAARMSGLPIGEAMNRETLGLVLGSTVFGAVFVVRAGLAVVLAGLIVALRRSNDDARRSRLAIVATAFAAAYLGSLAGSGHAVAGDESEAGARIVADVAHLLAAGAWLGALPAFVAMLGREGMPDAPARMAQRFSTLGVACVVMLIASGVVNAWYQVGSLPGLVGTNYGRLLLTKLALFAAMLGLATVNRGISTRPVSIADRGSLRSLRRNATLEIAFGIGVLAIVGVLGAMVPATHQPPLWPFGRTLSLDSVQQSAWMQLIVAGAGAIACVGALAVVVGALGRPPRLRIAAAAAVAFPGAILAYMLAVPACPTTYVVSPVPYAADAIATGSALYGANCARCHGRDGRREDSAAASAPNARRSLNDLVPERREGDLFGSIAHGIPGSAMPGYFPQLNDGQVWSLIQYLDARTAAQNALAMTDRIKPILPVPAPDFTYEILGRPQESLRQPKGNRVALLVFYTLPSSLERLRQLAGQERAYSAAGARIIALPMPESPSASPAVTGGEGSILALADPTVAATYRMFAHPSQGTDGGATAHLEYLVDRFGFLRARSIGLPVAGAAGAAGLLDQIDVLVHEPPREPVQWGHRH